MDTSELWTISEIHKFEPDHSEWVAVCNNGKEYSATYVNKYKPCGVMFFCIPNGVEILGYLKKL